VYLTVEQFMPEALHEPGHRSKPASVVTDHLVELHLGETEQPLQEHVARLHRRKLVDPAFCWWFARARVWNDVQPAAL
jgi:hypothetical protein